MMPASWCIFMFFMHRFNILKLLFIYLTSHVKERSFSVIMAFVFY